MNKIFKIVLVNIFFFIFFFELLSFFLVQLKIIPKHLPPVMALHANKEYSYWHPVKKKLTLSSKCWISDVEFNDIGLKSSINYSYIKKKPRIAILGDSMTENIQLSNQYDFASKLQSKLQSYEIINFSISSTGLADQIDIYNKLVKKFDVDYIFLFITENDFNDNYISYRRPNRLSYDLLNGKIVEYERDKIFFDNYFSSYNKWKRKYLFYFKDYSHSFKLYFEIKSIISYSNSKKEKVMSDFEFLKQKEIYNYLREKFTKSIDNKSKLFVFFNVNNLNFLNEDKVRTAMKQIWSSNIYFDPQINAIEYLKILNKLEPPYMGFPCDAHYSELGSEFLSDYVKKIFEIYK